MVWGMKAKVLSLIVIPTIIVLLMFALFIQRDMHNLYSEFSEHGYLIAKQVAISSEYGVITENMGTLNDVARSMIAIKDVEGVVILNSGQRAYVEQGHVQLIKEIPAEFQKPYICHQDDAVYIFCAPILYSPFAVSDFESEPSVIGNKVFIGSIQVSVSATILSQKISELITYAAAFILFTIISTLLMARRIDRQIIAPIVELTRVVKGISHGDLQQRAILKSSGEIFLLQEGVNLMAEELSSYHSDMQLKVDTATRELRYALQEIESKNAELEIARNRAEEASQAKSMFLAAMSHEIRTPLSGMLGMLNLIEQSELNPLQLDQIRNIEQASTALKSLIDDILDFSRMEAGKLNLVNKPFSIALLIDEVVTMLAPSAQLKGLEFVVDMERSLPAKVVGDSLRVRQVLINILSNAIKFTEAGGVTFRIRLSNTIAADQIVTVCFEIEDSGIGIPVERQQDVFERFSQVDQGRERHYEGSGLGATTAKQLVELMGGEICLSSEFGEGSRFTINLSWPVQGQTATPELLLKQLQGEQLLLLESNQTAGEVLQRYLEDSGAVVALLQNSTELAERLAAHHYDRIVISDAFDNESTRAELNAIQAEPQQGRTLIGIVSAFPDIGGHVLPEFAYDFRWAKPLTPNRLMKFIERSDETNSDDKPVVIGTALSLLVAEDDEINAKVITFLLEKRGHKVTRVTNGEAVLQNLLTEHYDAIFMDVRMPRMSGIDATRKWREHEQQSGGHIPIIALTANDSEHELCMAVGMDGFILKPIDDEALDQLEPLIPGVTMVKPG
jgi:two-component system sensor histidine kinase BarA